MILFGLFPMWNPKEFVGGFLSLTNTALYLLCQCIKLFLKWNALARHLSWKNVLWQNGKRGSCPDTRILSLVWLRWYHLNEWFFGSGIAVGVHSSLWEARTYFMNDLVDQSVRAGLLFASAGCFRRIPETEGMHYITVLDNSFQVGCIRIESPPSWFLLSLIFIFLPVSCHLCYKFHRRYSRVI